MTTAPKDIAALVERLRSSLDDIRFPLTLVETEDYAEVTDEDGVKVALTVKPDLFAAVNALPGLLDQIEALVKERDEAREKNDAYFDEVTACYATISDERQALEAAQAERDGARELLRTWQEAGQAAQARIGRLEGALKGVRSDLLNENGLNSLSISCTIWHSEIETTVDFISQALSVSGD